MTKKEELTAAALANGIEIPEGATIADIQQLLDDAEHAGVQPSPEVDPIPDSALATDPDAVAASDEPGAEPVDADHHHEAGLGPVLTPAGAHRHAPGEPEHIHRVEDVPGGPDHVSPTPHTDDVASAKPAKDQAVTVVVDRDHTVVFNSQLVELKKGQKVSGDLGAYLAAASDAVSKA